jgi:integrase
MFTSLRLTSRDARKKLKPRDAPYYVELRRGLHLGYRRHIGDAGSWLLREFRNGRYVKRRLGLTDDTVPSDGLSVLTWAEAHQLALGAERPTVTKPGKFTVADAAEAYFATRESTSPQDLYTWTQHIEPKLGDTPVSEITTGDLESWRATLVPKTEDREKRRRAQASANRYLNVLKAILNSAFRKDPDRVPSDAAWRRIRAFPKADKPRTRTLTRDEAKRLLSALGPPLRDLARSSLLTGLRFGELAALQAGDVGEKTVRVRHSKSGNPRTVPLNSEGAKFFASLAADEAPNARIFESISGTHVSRLMRKACTEAKIDPPAIFHDLRRSYGSLLLNAGAAADHIQELLGHADLRMTRRAYAHMADKTLEKAVKKLPSFG